MLNRAVNMSPPPPSHLNPLPFVQVPISCTDQIFVYSISLPLLLAVSRTRRRNRSRLDMVANETAWKRNDSILVIDILCAETAKKCKESILTRACVCVSLTVCVIDVTTSCF